MKDKSIRPEISVLKFEHMNLAKLKQKHLHYEINAANSINLTELPTTSTSHNTFSFPQMSLSFGITFFICFLIVMTFKCK